MVKVMPHVMLAENGITTNTNPVNFTITEVEVIAKTMKVSPVFSLVNKAVRVFHIFF